MSIKRIPPKSIIKLSSSEARDFFLKHESYCHIDLPGYFKFGDMLNGVSSNLIQNSLSTFYNDKKKPNDYDDVNHRLFHNKDGKYAWRPFQLIHPAIYVALVHAITEPTHWETIVKRFKTFSANKMIHCASLPVVSVSVHSDESEQVIQWWSEVEQKSIELALDYKCIYKTDITDCYSSIYTHSLAWALHDKDVAKKKRSDKSLIGNVIDDFLKGMSHGQTNGIPQGSALMDFIAEIVLGYVDMLLTNRVKSKVKNYRIIRYRDDYRIFVKHSVDGDIIIKYLSEVLIEVGLKLSPSKTAVSDSVIHNAVKPDKLYWLLQEQKHSNIQKQLLIIYNLANHYPNSGSLVIVLSDFGKQLSGMKNIFVKIGPLVSIIVEIACNNPRAYPECAVILSYLINFIKKKSDRVALINKIIKKIDKVPNTGHLQIWLQRFTLHVDEDRSYKERLCDVVKNGGHASLVWNSDWLGGPIRDLIEQSMIVDYSMLRSMPPVILPKEVSLFDDWGIY